MFIESSDGRLVNLSLATIIHPGEKQNGYVNIRLVFTDGTEVEANVSTMDLDRVRITGQ